MEALIEFAVLSVAGVRAAHVLTARAARRELRDHPILLVIVVAATLCVAATGIVLVRAWPPALRLITAVVLIVWGLLWWRAHPSMGRRRKLPPGSLGLRHSLDAIVDPEFYRREARRFGPVFKMAQFQRPVVCIVGLELGRRLLREEGDRLRPPPLPLSAVVPRGYLRYMTPRDHDRYAPLFRAAISEAALARIEEIARQEIHHALAGLAGASASAPNAGVDPRPSLEAAQVTALLRLYFGGLLRPEDRLVVDACSRDADMLSATGRASPRAIAALGRFSTLLDQRRAGYDCAADCSIWSEIVRLEPASVTDQTVIGNLFLLLEASRGSVGGLLAWMLQMMSQTPEWLARAQGPVALSEHGRGGDDDPAFRAVIETLRLAQSEYVYREVVEPVHVESFAIPKGWLVRICVAESHVSDPPFTDPDRFNPDRHLGHRFGVNEFSPFGLDAHACMGARLSLSFGRILARELLDHFTCSVVTDGPRVRGNRHWSHWEPSPNFRVSIRRRLQGVM